MTDIISEQQQNGESPEAVLRRAGRSFHWAARLLPPAVARDAAVLYAFCRDVDDLGDSAADEVEAAAALDVIAADLDRGTSARPEVAAFLDLAARRHVPLAAAQGLVAGVRDDLAAPLVADAAALVRYAYRVAGTVGLMMCPILGVRATWATPFAVDLGIALQMTNIARDVVEDAKRGRRYLPASDLGADLPPAALVAPDPATAQRAFAGVCRLLDRAEVYRRSAERGLRAIPLPARLAILTAGRVYAGIGTRVRALGPADYWHTRAVVPPAGKAARTAGAFLAAFQPGFWDVGPPPAHDSTLHAPLAGWPGVDPEAQ